jgi:putative transposase
MSRYRHWKNYAEGGEVAFITTTALDFVHIFDTPESKRLMLDRLVSDHRHYGGTLHSYVIMSNHLHFISRIPEGRDVSWFVQRIKSNSAKEIHPGLTADHLAALSMQKGLNRRSVWQDGFRSIRLRSEEMFWQKVKYIHLNPVRAGLVEAPEAYLWSSAALFLNGKWSEEEGLSLGVI